MSTIPFSFARSSDGTETVVLLGSQGVRVVSDSHANYEAIRDALVGGGSDEAEIYELADAAAKIVDTISRISDRVTLRRDTLYLDGDAVETRLTRHIVEMIKGGDENYVGYVAFLENLQANPSRKSRKSLFKFLDKHDLIITEDGCFIGYKGIATDGLSISSGVEPVTVTLTDGTVEEHTGRIPNPVGATVEIPRTLVDPDRNAACSVGLHVGNYTYANNFSTSGRFLTVKVNPRDVVSVPSDASDQKIRTCRYVILEENAGRTRYAGTSFVSLEKDLEGEDVDPGFDPECEDCQEYCGGFCDENAEESNTCSCCEDASDDLDAEGHCENCRSCG